MRWSHRLNEKGESVPSLSFLTTDTVSPTLCCFQPQWPTVLLNHETKQMFLSLSCYCQVLSLTQRKNTQCHIPAITSYRNSYLGKEESRDSERWGIWLRDSPNIPSPPPGIWDHQLHRVTHSGFAVSRFNFTHVSF